METGNHSMDRYANNPFLRLLDSYVLKAIGQLDEKHEQSLRQMTPDLVKIYGVQGSWDEIVAQEMEFSPDTPSKIKEIWEKNVEMAKAQRQSIDPKEFAIHFISYYILQEKK
jgi:hypothetical protein